MSTIITRAGKGSPLTNNEMDANLTNLNTDKIEVAYIHSATSKTTPVNADEIPLVDSEASNSLKKLTWANIKATLKSYFDGIYFSLATSQPTFRNKIINGAMKVDQRNSGASQTLTAGAYCVDRWYGYCTGANISGQRIALSNGQNRYRFTGAASNTGVGFGQRIEAANSMDLAGLTATLSVKLSSSSLTSITWTAFRANTADTFGTLASPSGTQIATGTFTINSTEATYSATFSVPANATTGIEIVFTGGALLGTQTLTIGDVQLEVGSAATPFEHRPYGAELALCQRYYYGTQVQLNISAYASAPGQYVYASHTLPVTMRTTPTIAGAEWINGVNANPQSFRMADARTVESSITSAGAGICAAVVVFSAFHSEL